jgi:hypothetical protein
MLLKYIHSSELQKYLKEGWNLGRRGYNPHISKLLKENRW